MQDGIPCLEECKIGTTSIRTVLNLLSRFLVLNFPMRRICQRIGNKMKRLLLFISLKYVHFLLIYFCLFLSNGFCSIPGAFYKPTSVPYFLHVFKDENIQESERFFTHWSSPIKFLKLMPNSHNFLRNSQKKIFLTAVSSIEWHHELSKWL